MTDKEIENIKNKYWDIAENREQEFELLANEAYSLGQSHMKQKAIDCVPNSVSYWEETYEAGFRKCREQALLKLNEL